MEEGRILFDWSRVRDVAPPERYRESALGYGRWREVFSQDDYGPEWERFALDTFHRGLDDDPSRSSARKTVFISHRQADHAPALDASRRLNARGIDTWLDIEDPNLTAINALRRLSPFGWTLLTALIIEMALLNSTHVLALLTANTPGSRWVPYEYGRIKRPVVASPEAASLRLGGPLRPEYMLLGKQFTKLTQLDDPGWP